MADINRSARRDRRAGGGVAGTRGLRPAARDGERVEEVLPCRNVAADPARRFEIDPAALLAAHRAARGGGRQVVGCYHSHPAGAAEPSPRDAAGAAPDGSLWLIVGQGRVTAWRAVARGTRHGRFDPVALGD